MKATDSLKQAHGLSNMVFRAYLSDLSDADLLERPGEGCNHIAWQLGHLIKSNVALLEAASPGSAPTLPEGFEEKYTNDTTANDDPASFHSKDEYLALIDSTDAAFLKLLDNATPEDLDQPTPESFQDFAPNIGALYNLIATHPMMHCGQWVPVRRRLGKPVVI